MRFRDGVNSCDYFTKTITNSIAASRKYIYRYIYIYMNSRINLLLMVNNYLHDQLFVLLYDQIANTTRGDPFIIRKKVFNVYLVFKVLSQSIKFCQFHISLYY